jgi:cell pole-organizing protein PopZ
MSGATAPGQDPSMEDILASIRKILNEEEAAPDASPAVPAAAPRPGPALQPELEMEPLELTDAMMVASPAPEPPVPLPPAPEPDPVVAAPQPIPQPAPAMPTEPTPPMKAVPMEPGESLVAPATAAAAAALIGQLARAVAAERTAPVHRSGPSIEDVVREEVRPLLKEWLDAHLPPIVERLVRAEIERVVSRSLG